MNNNPNIPSVSVAPVARATSQATTIEQTRAIADVQAAAQMARVFPRDEAAALARALEECSKIELAERAFFELKRGKNPVTGPTVHLAKQLARAWGNVVFGLKELRRETGQSEMIAFAWDLQDNVRSEATFIVEHRRPGKSAATLESTTDIQENNTSMGARRLREMIFDVLPKSFVEQAIAKCHETQQKGGSEKTIAERRAGMIAAFEEIGVSKKRLEDKIGAPSAEWTLKDITDMAIVYNSIREGSMRVDEAFPRTPTVTATDLTGVNTETGEVTGK
jgi:hypothetical protein